MLDWFTYRNIAKIAAGIAVVIGLLVLWACVDAGVPLLDTVKLTVGFSLAAFVSAYGHILAPVKCERFRRRRNQAMRERMGI